MSDSPIAFTPDEVSGYYAARVPLLAQNDGREWKGPCPIHEGTDDNFKVESVTGKWFCHSQCGRGGDILELELQLHGGSFTEVKAEVFRLAGRLFPVSAKITGLASGWREVTRYSYENPEGRPLFEVIRYLKPNGDKAFMQCRQDGNGGTIWNLNGIDRLPYRLPQILRAHTIYLPEGEKDVHTLETWGLVGSCNSGGSATSHLYARWTEYFRGRRVVILVDNDDPGRKHALIVAAALLNVASSVRIVEFPGLPSKGDVTDWCEAGGTREQLRELTEAAPPMSEAALSELRARWQLSDDGQKRVVEQSGDTRCGQVVTRRLSEIKAKPISWLWPGWIARGKVTLIAGNPGLGKSLITANMAGIVTTGGAWPVDGTRCTSGDVLFFSAEDDPADTLRPRLEAAGADLERVHFVDGIAVSGFSGNGPPHPRAFSLQSDLDALEAKLAALAGVSAVVIDPITAYLGGTDSHKNAEVRALLAPLSELAARYNAAIIAVSHLNKAAGMQALMRVSGSLAFVAAARGAYLVAEDPKDSARRLFLPLKNNIGPDTTGFAFSLEIAMVQTGAGVLETRRVVWESERVSTSADDVLAATAEQPKLSAVGRTQAWLQDQLSGGPTAAAEVFDRGRNVGFPEITIRRAADALGVQKTKAGLRGGWVWNLTKVIIGAEDAHQEDVSTFE